MKKPALLIIDMQNDFVRDGAPLKVSDADLIIGKIQSVLAVFRKKRLPVFHVIRVHRRDGSDVELFRSNLFKTMPFAVEGTKGAGIIGELEPCEGEYLIRKTRMSAFMHTGSTWCSGRLGLTRSLLWESRLRTVSGQRSLMPVPSTTR